jgi:hypothetical protein
MFLVRRGPTDAYRTADGLTVVRVAAIVIMGPVRVQGLVRRDFNRRAAGHFRAAACGGVPSGEGVPGRSGGRKGAIRGIVGNSLARRTALRVAVRIAVLVERNRVGVRLPGRKEGDVVVKFQRVRDGDSGAGGGAFSGGVVYRGVPAGVRVTGTGGGRQRCRRTVIPVQELKVFPAF